MERPKRRPWPPDLPNACLLDCLLCSYWLAAQSKRAPFRAEISCAHACRDPDDQVRGSCRTGTASRASARWPSSTNHSEGQKSLALSGMGYIAARNLTPPHQGRSANAGGRRLRHLDLTITRDPSSGRVVSKTVGNLRETYQ